MANTRGELPLHVRLDRVDREVESTYSYAGGGTVLVLSTVLPERGLALELISTYAGHPDTGTIVTRLVLGPEGHPSSVHSRAHQQGELDPVEHARECAYDHAHALIDALHTAGHEASVELDEPTFWQLERIE